MHIKNLLGAALGVLALGAPLRAGIVAISNESEQSWQLSTPCFQRAIVIKMWLYGSDPDMNLPVTYAYEPGMALAMTLHPKSTVSFRCNATPDADPPSQTFQLCDEQGARIFPAAAHEDSDLTLEALPCPGAERQPKEVNFFSFRKPAEVHGTGVLDEGGRHFRILEPYAPASPTRDETEVEAPEAGSDEAADPGVLPPR